MANLLSLLILVVLLWGITLHRKNLRLHIQVMLGVVAADLILVGYLVAMRDALGKVSPQMPWTLEIHVPIAIFTVLLYFVTAWTGFQLYRGYLVRNRLRQLARILIVARILTLVTSLMVQFISVN